MVIEKRLLEIIDGLSKSGLSIICLHIFRIILF